MSQQRLGDSEAKQREYYDRIADTYDSHYGSSRNLEYRARIFDPIFAGIDLRGAKVLDAMCGGGQNAAYFLARGSTVTGVDISPRQCELYAQRFPQSTVRCASVLETGLDDQSVDLVFTDSLHHLHPQVDAGVTEMWRVLRPGGYLVVWEPCAGSIFDLLRKAWYRLDRTYFEDNEASIDVRRLARDHAARFQLDRAVFGGNVGYVLVALSMAMRLPVRWLDWYAAAALRLEEAVQRVQTRRTALWVLARFRKL